MSLQDLLKLPIPFWIAVALILGAGFYYLRQLRRGLALPVFAVLGTIGGWYIGDVLYNDYVGYFLITFTPEVLTAAWWQVDLFLLAFLSFVPYVHNYINKRFLGQQSYAYHLFKHGVDNKRFQSQISLMFYGCFSVWVILVTLAVIRLGDQSIYYFFPFLGERADPWGRGRIGGGFDSILSLLGHVQLFTASSFGMVAAVSTNPLIRATSLFCCALTWPNYLLDRVRNTMLSLVVPAVLMWAGFRVRGSWFTKLLVTLPFFIVVNLWMAFVIANRSDTTIAEAIEEKGFSLQEVAAAHHEGLNMYEELCWVNSLTASGMFTPNWGGEYYAELMNPIPRALWPGKPLIGLDYSVARGQGGESADGADASATIASGLIGQGIVNFGRFIGPVIAAFLMSLWAAILARIDLTGYRLGRMPLLALGLILTFNLGRGLTFLTLYTFIFGVVIVLLAEYLFGTNAGSRGGAAPRRRRGNKAMARPAPQPAIAPPLEPPTAQA